jgi:SnoaL-like domain
MDIRSTLTELCEAFNAHDLDRIMAFFSDDCVLEMPRGSKPWGSRFEGKQMYEKRWQHALKACLMSTTATISILWIRLPILASQNGPSQGPPARGRERRSKVVISTRFATAR